MIFSQHLPICGLASIPATVFADEPAWLRGGPEKGAITVLVADPQHPTTIRAGTLDGGSWKTADGSTDPKKAKEPRS